MAKTYTRLRNALLEIADFSDREWKRAGGFPPLGNCAYWKRELLEKKLPKDDDGIELPLPEMPHYVFLLPPTGNSVNGFLSVNWKFVPESSRADQSSNQVTASEGYVSRAFRVFLIPTNAGQRIAPTVVRFDERENNKGWRFAHAQLCDTIEPYDEYFFRADPPNWVSATLPRIPLAATHGATAILVCLLAGLYGVDSQVFKRVLRVLSDKDSHAVARQLRRTEK